jgi:hypothetical protein
MGSLLTISWAELRPEYAWLKLKAGSMRRAGLIGRPGNCGSDARGDVEAFIHDGRVQMNAGADADGCEQWHCQEDIAPAGTIPATLLGLLTSASRQVRMSSLQKPVAILGCLAWKLTDPLPQSSAEPDWDAHRHHGAHERCNLTLKNEPPVAIGAFAYFRSCLAIPSLLSTPRRTESQVARRDCLIHNAQTADPRFCSPHLCLYTPRQRHYSLYQKQILYLHPCRQNFVLRQHMSFRKQVMARLPTRITPVRWYSSKTGLEGNDVPKHLCFPGWSHSPKHSGRGGLFFFAHASPERRRIMARSLIV